MPEIGLSARISINKKLSAPCFLSEPRKSRGRMSVTVRPSLSALEMNKTVIKRKSKSVGDISEISPAFIEHLKTLRTENGGGLQAFEKFETLSKQAKAEDDDSPGVLKRSTSQTVTEKEIKIVEEADKKNIWEIPSMARKSKIALAILFIGGRLGSAVQNNLSHLSQIASEEKVAGMAQPIIKGQTIGPKKTGVGRSFSFSMKNKGAGLLKDKKYQRPPVAPKPSLRQLSEGDDETLDTPAYWKRHGSSLPSAEYAVSGADLKLNKRCMSLTALNTTSDKDLRKLAEAQKRHSSSSGRLLAPDGVNYHQSCEDLTDRDRGEMEARKSCFSTDGKNDSSNEFSSDGEEREAARIRLSRSRSISVVTRNMIFNKKSVLKKKLRCPPHNFVSVSSSKLDWECEECRSETSEIAFVRCTYCEYLVHKACSMQLLENPPTSPPPIRDKKTHKKLNFELLKKKPSNQDLRDLTLPNGCKKISPSEADRTSLHRRQSSFNSSEAALFQLAQSDSDDDCFSEESEEEYCWRDSVSPTVQSVMNKDDEERMHSIYELLNTEKNQVRRLKILIRVFKFKLMEKQHITAKESNQLFPALDDLLESCSILYTQLKESLDVESPHTTHQIGNIIVNNFSQNKPVGVCMRDAYARLGARKLIAVKYYREKCKEKAFKSLMDMLESKKLCQRRTYADLLLAVTTRLTKFPLLLKNLSKHTPENHPDYLSLREAISVVEEALSYINNYVMLDNQRAELELLQTRLEVKGRCSRELKHFDLSSNIRTLIHKDQVTHQITRPGGSTKDSKVQLFLYNDYILLLKEKDSKLTLNFDDNNCPAIKVKDCTVKNDKTEKLGFMLISNSGKSKESPAASITKSHPTLYRSTLYRFLATSADDKETWIRLITRAISSEQPCLTEEDPVPIAAELRSLSSEGGYDDSDMSDLDTSSVIERVNSVSFDEVDVELDNSNDPSPDSSRHLPELDGISEQHDDSFSKQDQGLDLEEDDLDRVISFLRSLGGGRPSRPASFNRPVPRPNPKPGAAARRAISLHLAEKQKRVEENRRHTTCLSNDDLKEAMSNSGLPANLSLQDNPVRQKSSDSGYAPEEILSQSMPSGMVWRLRDCLLTTAQDSKRKEDTIQRQGAAIADLRKDSSELRTIVEQQSASLSRLEEEMKELRLQVSDSPRSPSQRSSKRVYNTYSIAEEKSDTPQTRV